MNMGIAAAAATEKCAKLFAQILRTVYTALYTALHTIEPVDLYEIYRC